MCFQKYRRFPFKANQTGSAVVMFQSSCRPDFLWKKVAQDFPLYLLKEGFWETGMIGQVLYLEAEAHGVRGTGIGCFLDDPVHEILGLKDHTFQSLYHFTIGGPVEDARL